jgi:hypothetical protein
VKVARARDHSEEEQDSDSCINGNTGGLVKDRLAECTEKGETVADKVKLGNL